MFSKKIKFQAPKSYIENNQDILPVPTKLNIPEWFKKLSHTPMIKTIKGCMPFLDSLTAGYILKMPVDYYVEHNVTVAGEKKTGFKCSHSYMTEENKTINLNFDTKKEFHPTKQIENSPLLQKNHNLPVHKIFNPWLIKTPPGYSTLFIPLMNNQDDRFSIIPGIVDTDTFVMEINFPIIFNGDKYKELKTVIKRGTPYVQLIPFKRDSWKMSVEPVDTVKLGEEKGYYFKLLVNNYKNFHWSKKSWK